MEFSLFQIYGQIVDDKSHIFEAIKEHNELASNILGFSWGNLFLHILPALRHLPRFPPYLRLMDAVNKRERLWNEVLGPALVSALSSTIILGTRISDS